MQGVAIVNITAGNGELNFKLPLLPTALDLNLPGFELPINIYCLGSFSNYCQMTTARKFVGPYLNSLNFENEKSVNF